MAIHKSMVHLYLVKTFNKNRFEVSGNEKKME